VGSAKYNTLKRIFTLKTTSLFGAITIVLILSACAGRPANPVLVQQYGDNKKSCSTLEKEMVLIQTDIQRLIPETEKTGTNTALGVTGFFFIVPLFFMDLSESEQIEINAFRQRYNHLMIIASEKKCDVDAEEIPDFNKNN
jgi:hypothetical protein